MLRLMDQLVAGIAIAAQQTIHRELPAGFAGVIIGDDDLLISLPAVWDMLLGREVRKI